MTQKTEGQEDLRVQRTRKLLQQALLELTVEKGFAAITVRDITRHAMVNRSTFYRHYVDKYELLNQYLDELQVSISEAALLAEKTGRTSPEKLPAGLLILTRHVQQYAKFYRVMLGRNGDPLMTQRFRQMVENRFRYLFSRHNVKIDPKAPPLEMKLSYISSAAVGAILWWLENNQPCTAEQLAIWLSQLNMTTAGLTLQGTELSSP